MAYATQHNGGKSQININFTQFSGDFPFLNCYKNASDPGDGSNNSLDPALVDANGWGNGSTVARLCFVPRASDRPGDYVAKWSGVGSVTGPAGTIRPSSTFTCSVTGSVLTVTTAPTNYIAKGMTFSAGGRIGDQLTGTAGGVGTYQLVNYSGGNLASGSRSVDGGATTNAVDGQGRYIITLDDAGARGRIPINTTSGVTNLVFCHVDDEARLEAGEVFGVQFKSRLIEANVGVIRFMDWMNNNTSDVALYSDQRSSNYATWAGPEHRKSIAVAAPSGAGSALTCAAPAGFTRANRQKVMFKTGTIGGAAPYTIDVGGTGAAPIVSWQGIDNYALASATTYCLTWIAELNAYLAMPGGLVSGVPIAVCLQLCAEIGAHPHFNTPTLAGDGPAGSNYWATGLANEIKAFKTANNVSWICERLEGPNETWNFAGGVMQVWIANRVQWKNNGGGAYPSDPNNIPQSAGFTATALTYPSAAMGAGYVDFTLSAPRPSNLVVGSNLYSIGFNANGMNNADNRSYYVAAVDVGGNTSKITCVSSVALTGTYNGGGGGWLQPAQYDFHNWYARVFGKTMQAYIAAYGDGGAGRRVNYKFLIGVQTGYGDASTGGSATERFDGPCFVLQGGVAPYTLATHGCIANYFTPANYAKIAEVRAVYNYFFTYASDPVSQASVVAAYVDSLNTNSGFTVTALRNNFFAGWKTYLKTKGLDLTCYEGGYSPDYQPETWAGTGNWGPTSIVVGATQANPCVVSLGVTATAGAFQTGDGSYKFSGVNGCVAGMQVNFFNVAGMTQLNCGTVTLQTDGGRPGGLTFTNASAIIGWDSAIAPLPLVGQSISFDCVGSPWPFGTSIVKGALYWVVSRDTINKRITVSATKGGSAITITGSPVFEDIRAQSGWRVLSVNDTTNQITIDCDSTGFSAWTATPGTPELQWCLYDRGDYLTNAFRYISKFCPSSPLMPGTGVGGWVTQSYNDFLALNVGEASFRAENPSCFTLCDERASYSYKDHDPQIWAVLSNIYQPTAQSPQWQAIINFNTVQARPIHLRMRLHR